MGRGRLVAQLHATYCPAAAAEVNDCSRVWRTASRLHPRSTPRRLPPIHAFYPSTRNTRRRRRRRRRPTVFFPFFFFFCPLGRSFLPSGKKPRIVTYWRGGRGYKKKKKKKATSFPSPLSPGWLTVVSSSSSISHLASSQRRSHGEADRLPHGRVHTHAHGHRRRSLVRSHPKNANILASGSLDHEVRLWRRCPPSASCASTSVSQSRALRFIPRETSSRWLRGQVVRGTTQAEPATQRGDGQQDEERSGSGAGAEAGAGAGGEARAG